jgi:hypothetical protein
MNFGLDISVIYYIRYIIVYKFFVLFYVYINMD